MCKTNHIHTLSVHCGKTTHTICAHVALCAYTHYCAGSTDLIWSDLIDQYMDRTIYVWGSMEGMASQTQNCLFVIYLKRERERERVYRNWKGDLVIAIEMRKRVSVWWNSSLER